MYGAFYEIVHLNNPLRTRSLEMREGVMQIPYSLTSVTLYFANGHIYNFDTSKSKLLFMTTRNAYWYPLRETHNYNNNILMTLSMSKSQHEIHGNNGLPMYKMLHDVLLANLDRKKSDYQWVNMIIEEGWSHTNGEFS